jgi:hypothetical protein
MVDGFLELNALLRNGKVSTPTDAVKKILGREPRGFEEWARDYAKSQVMHAA